MLTLREYRTALNLTQSEFGERLGVSAQQVSNWENGFRFPSAKSLLNIAETYRVTVQVSKKGVYIVPDEEMPKPSPVFDCALAGNEIVITSEDEFSESQAIWWFYFHYGKDYPNPLEKIEKGRAGHLNFIKFKVVKS